MTDLWTDPVSDVAPPDPWLTPGLAAFLRFVAVTVALLLTANVAYAVGRTAERLDHAPAAVCGDPANPSGIRDAGTLRLTPRKAGTR